MIEILDCRDLTEKEKKKLEFEKKLKELEEENEAFLRSAESAEETLDETPDERIISTSEDAEDRRAELLMATEMIEKLEDKNSADELTEEQERIVSKAISKENNSIELTEEQLKEIKERTEKEYKSICGSNENTLKKRLKVILFILSLFVIVSVINATQKAVKYYSVLPDDVKRITVPINEGE